MLHPAIEVRENKTIHQNGLFATQLILKGELVWQLDAPTLTWKQVEALSENRREAFDWYGFQCGVDRYSLPDDDSREANHSCDPNTWWADSDSIIARRDILANEEVTYDYSTCDIDLVFKMECHCGSSNCRGKITHRDYLNSEWQKHYGLNLPGHVLTAIENC
jgi:SET domain-containing protein